MWKNIISKFFSQYSQVESRLSSFNKSYEHPIHWIHLNIVQWNLDLRKPDLRKNLDLRKIVATTDFLVHKLFDLRKIF